MCTGLYYKCVHLYWSLFPVILGDRAGVGLLGYVVLGGGLHNCMALASYIPTSSTCHSVIACTCIVWVFKTMCVGTCTASLCFLIKNVYPEKVVDLGSCKKQCRFRRGPGTLSGQHLWRCRTCSSMWLLVIWLLWFLCWLVFKLFWGLVLGNKHRAFTDTSCLLPAVGYGLHLRCPSGHEIVSRCVWLFFFCHPHPTPTPLSGLFLNQGEHLQCLLENRLIWRNFHIHILILVHSFFDLDGL